MIRKRVPFIPLFLLGFVLFTAATAWATAKTSINDSSKHFEPFRHLAILDEGRIKPLETYSRKILLQFSGKTKLNGSSAAGWIARVLFTPWETEEDRVFLVNSPEIPAAIGQQARKDRRYSFRDFEPGLGKLRELAIAADAIDPKERNLVETEILRVYNNIDLYIQLRGALAFTVPHPDFNINSPAVKGLLGFPEGRELFSFLDIALKAEAIDRETTALESTPSSAWSEDDRELLRLLRNLYQWSLSAGARPGEFRIMPSPDRYAGELWYSPWELIKNDFSNEATRQEITFLQNMSDAFRMGRELDFGIAARAFHTKIAGRVPYAQKSKFTRAPLEVIYQKTQFFSLAGTLYGLTFLFFLFSLYFKNFDFRPAGLLLLVVASVPHFAGMVMRMLIMARPPVTNLYETFIFVGFVCVLICLLTEIVNKKWLGIVAGSASGFLALAIADKFSAEGDTLKMLVAVLDSNFWLSTHVLTITIGYAGCCVAGIMGHAYIIQALWNHKNSAALNSTYRFILGTLGFGLTASFFGTMLGGIWADQSWGRFWGWDPKENGALMIVLWSAIIFHAKIGRMIKPLGVAIGSIFGLIVVMWAWFGVNLLSIGLHSYGFTSGLATNLGIYVVAEILFLGTSSFILVRRGVKI